MGGREGRPYGEAGTGGVEPRPYGGVTRSAVNGPSGKSAKRRQWRKKRADFEEVPRLAGTTVAVSRLARRWATAGPYGWVASRAAEWATARVAPTGCNMGCGGAGRCGHRPLRKRSKNFGKRAAWDMQERASLRPPFGFLGIKIPASKAGSILPYYGGGDNARKNFVGGEILSHTMIFF